MNYSLTCLTELQRRYPLVLDHPAIYETFAFFLGESVRRHPSELAEPAILAMGIEIMDACQRTREAAGLTDRADWPDHRWLQFHLSFLLTYSYGLEVA